ncbi:MAG: OmpH family outer membrane protein [Paludibacteraceae bacterium]|nr:OmpH family outer membrane protein [Paludibacteraceae bacterium]
MKSINTILLAILCVAVGILYVLHFSSKKCDSAASKDCQAVAKSVSVDSFPIAYVNVDTLLLTYQYAKDLNESLLKKQEKSRKELAEKDARIRADYAAYLKMVEAYKNKVATGQVLTQETREKEESVLMKEEARLNKKNQELKDLDQRLNQELFLEQQKLNSQLRDTINAFFAIYNQDKHYKMILCDTGNDNIFFAEDYLNITSDVVEALNKQYKPVQK